jgi:hypothetical protein
MPQRIIDLCPSHRKTSKTQFLRDAGEPRRAILFVVNASVLQAPYCVSQRGIRETGWRELNEKGGFHARADHKERLGFTFPVTLVS